jgi:hypothetical protein
MAEKFAGRRMRLAMIVCRRGHSKPSQSFEKSPPSESGPERHVSARGQQGFGSKALLESRLSSAGDGF